MTFNIFSTITNLFASPVIDDIVYETPALTPGDNVTVHSFNASMGGAVEYPGVVLAGLRRSRQSPVHALARPGLGNVPVRRGYAER